MQALTKESFLEDVKNHKVEVLKNDGVYRHLHCSTGSIMGSFDVITYPGHLVISGDMGTNVFSRTEDMFEFFNQKVDDGINASYWGEKLQDDKSYGKAYSSSGVIESIKNRINEVCEENPLAKELRAELEEYFSIEEGALYYESEYARVICNFESEIVPSLNFLGEDGFEWVNSTEYSRHFIWRLWAIVWTIEEFRKFESKLI